MVTKVLTFSALAICVSMSGCCTALRSAPETPVTEASMQVQQREINNLLIKLNIANDNLQELRTLTRVTDKMKNDARTARRKAYPSSLESRDLEHLAGILRRQIDAVEQERDELVRLMRLEGAFGVTH